MKINNSMGWALGVHLTLLLSYLKKRVTVPKKKALAEKVGCVYEMYQPQAKTQNCIFKPHIYSFIFQLSVQTAQKRPKSLENPVLLCRCVQNCDFG